MVHVMRGANSVANPDLPVSKARVEMVERLIDHYLGHEDLADTFERESSCPRRHVDLGTTSRPLSIQLGSHALSDHLHRR